MTMCALALARLGLDWLESATSLTFQQRQDSVGRKLEGSLEI